MTPRKERENRAVAPPKSHRPRPAKTGRDSEASSLRRERPREKEKQEMSDAAVEMDAKVKTTVVDIDSVREDEVKEENLGLLEAAEQEDGETQGHKF